MPRVFVITEALIDMRWRGGTQRRRARNARRKGRGREKRERERVCVRVREGVRERTLRRFKGGTLADPLEMLIVLFLSLLIALAVFFERNFRW